MAASGALSEQQVLAIGHSLLAEVARLHAAGGVSGVIGPSTVLVDEHGTVRLTGAVGVPDQAYAAPEVLTGQPPTTRSDLYSVAALLAHLFRGGATLPPTVADLDPGVAWLLGPVLATDPEARPGSASSMLAALDQLAEQRHGRDWRPGAGLAALAGTAGAVPVIVLAAGGTASTAGVTGGVATVGGGFRQGVVGSSVQAAGHTSHGVAGGISKGLLIKVGAAVIAGGVVVAGGAAAVVALSGGAETEKVRLPATANIYLAGADDEVAAQLSAPGSSPLAVDVGGAGKVSFPSIKGELGACDACERESPDGGSLSFGSTGITAFNGIAGVTFADRTLFVVGVFVGDDQPSHPAEAVVDLSGADDELSQEPGLGEPFFIGDGETADGERQEVVVPENAETLYLGFADAYGFYGTPGAYDDNHGSVTIEVAVD